MVELVSIGPDDPPFVQLACIALRMAPTSGEFPDLPGWFPEASDIRFEVPMMGSGTMIPVALGVVGGSLPGQELVRLMPGGPALAGANPNTLAPLDTVFEFDEPYALVVATMALATDIQRPGIGWFDVIIRAIRQTRIVFRAVDVGEWPATPRAVGRVGLHLLDGDA